MLPTQNVLNINTANQVLPVMRVLCYGGAIALVGRKVVQGLASGAYITGSKVANYMNHKRLAESLEKTGDWYLIAAKKNLLRDLSVAGGLTIAGLGVELAENAVAEKLADIEADNFLGNTWGKLKNIASNMWEGTKSIASNLNNNGIVFGDNRYPLEKINDNIQRLNDHIQYSTKCLFNDFRLTAPYQAPFTKNFVGTIGPNNQQKIWETIMGAPKAL